MKESIKKALPMIAGMGLWSVISNILAERIPEYSKYGVLGFFVISVFMAIMFYIVYDEPDEKWVRVCAIVIGIIFIALAWDEYYRKIQKKMVTTTEVKTLKIPSKSSEMSLNPIKRMVCKLKYQNSPEVQIRQNCQIKNCGNDNTTRFKQLPAGSQITVDFNQETTGKYSDNRTITFIKIENYGADKWISKNIIDKNSCIAIVK